MSHRIFWSQQARDDLRSIRDYLALNAPATAPRYVQEIRKSVERLREFPYSGQVVAELAREDVREILHGNYRLIYRVSAKRIEIVTVFHGARIFRLEE